MQVKAWIVAVQEYEKGLRITAPVTKWALELAMVLEEQGVKPEDVVLSISAPASFDGQLAAFGSQGYQRTDATLTGIQSALKKLGGGDFLLVYWVGHGVKDSADRLLLTAESQHDSLTAVDVDALLAHLRSQRFSRVQVSFFDCCAQVVSSSSNKYSPGAMQETATRQFSYFAASSAEIAAADDSRPGFSSTVIKALREGDPFPPAIDQLFSSLKISFESLQKSGDIRTRPAEIQWTSDPGKTWSRIDSHRRLLSSWKTLAVVLAPIASVSLALGFAFQPGDTNWRWNSDDLVRSNCRQLKQTSVCDYTDKFSNKRDLRYHTLRVQFDWIPGLDKVSWSLTGPLGVSICRLNIRFPREPDQDLIVESCGATGKCVSERHRSPEFSGNAAVFPKNITLTLKQQSTSIVGCLSLYPQEARNSGIYKIGFPQQRTTLIGSAVFEGPYPLSSRGGILRVEYDGPPGNPNEPTREVSHLCPIDLAPQ